MDYRALLAVPLAALALTANSADKLRVPDGWSALATHDGPDRPTHEAGVAPETERSGQRALTVRALGDAQPDQIGSIGQWVTGYAGKRLRFTAQVKTAAGSGWGGLVVAPNSQPLAFQAYLSRFISAPPLGTAGCADWCEVSVVADIPDLIENGNSGNQFPVGLALIGKGQVWARSLRVEAVGTDVPLTTEVFAAKAAEAARLAQEQAIKTRAALKTAPKNLALR